MEKQSDLVNQEELLLLNELNAEEINMQVLDGFVNESENMQRIFMVVQRLDNEHQNGQDLR